VKLHDLSRGRLRREWRTIEAMIAIYCAKRHGGRRGALCADCGGLRGYARARLERCPFGPGKSTCTNCRVHCYRTAMRERAREAMRFAGPRMLARHPYLTLMHVLVDERRPAPQLPRRQHPHAQRVESGVDARLEPVREAGQLLDDLSRLALGGGGHDDAGGDERHDRAYEQGDDQRPPAQAALLEADGDRMREVGAEGGEQHR
jgi:hypothetical protein